MEYELKKKNKFRLSIIEDSTIHSEWLKFEILESANFEVASVDSFGRQGIESVKQHQPDLVLLDFQLKDMTGLEVAKRIKVHGSKIKIFALTAHTEISILERIINDKNIDAIAIKGSHYFDDNLLTAIRHVITGGTYLDPSLLKKLRELGNPNGLSDLTKREFEVFIQTNIGKSDEQIAADLFVEQSHVRNLKSKISKKLKGNDLDNLLQQLVSNTNPNRFQVDNQHES